MSTARPFTQRVEVGSFYTDGTSLWEVVEVHALGSVDLVDVASGKPRFMGIDAFRREMWRAR